MEDYVSIKKPNWVKTSIMCKCPNCGKGNLFENLLKFKPNCTSCGMDFSNADSGDGPAVIVIGIAGAILVPIMLALSNLFHLKPLILLLIMFPLTIGTCIALLMPIKSVLYTMQIKNKAFDPKAKDFKID